ncbi:MAG: UDP-2,3-diacylglucosamine diphosphatase, partial [Bacteroidota bacterium]|nr:UDP-2,3-diacylglucosamine diphosphatase [Bacteroidota bacterium]
KKFVAWLDNIKKDAEVLFILGDLFDFWFEYKHVIPKGFTRVLGKLAELSDQGIEIHFFTGNHDMWMHNYFEEELSIVVYNKPQEFELNGKLFLIGHGDGLGPHDKGYKRLKKVFSNPFFKSLYRWIHPDLGVRFAQYLSQKNKLISGDNDLKFKGNESEWLTQYARRKLEYRHYDYFLFGHRHLPLEVPLNQKSYYFNLGDWITHFSYGVFDGQIFKLEKYNTD